MTTKRKELHQVGAIKKRRNGSFYREAILNQTKRWTPCGTFHSEQDAKSAEHIQAAKGRRTTVREVNGGWQLLALIQKRKAICIYVHNENKK